MKFTINRPAFINQLNNVLRAISSKTTIPILTGLKMVVSLRGSVSTWERTTGSLMASVKIQVGAMLGG